MKKVFTYLLLTILILLGNIQTMPVASAAINQGTVCEFLNNQNKSVEKGTSQGTPSGGQTNEFANKLVVITEEKLGNPDNKTTFMCSRKIDFSAPPATTPGKPGESTPAPANTYKTSYVSDCKSTLTPAQINEARQNGQPFTICEPVMVYLSAAGTGLLYYYIGQVYRYVAGVGGLLAVLILVIAGIMRTTAGDNTNQITQANNLVTKSITGLIVLFLSAIILYTINPNFFTL